MERQLESRIFILTYFLKNYIILLNKIYVNGKNIQWRNKNESNKKRFIFE